MHRGRTSQTGARIYLKTYKPLESGYPGTLISLIPLIPPPAPVSSSAARGI